MNDLKQVLDMMHEMGLIDEAYTISSIVKGSKDGFSLAELKSATDKLSSMSGKDIEDLLSENDEVDNITVIGAKFIDSMYFSSALKGLTATYSIAYTKSENKDSDITKKLVYITWDGQSFTARF